VSDSDRIGPITPQGYAHLQVCAICGAMLTAAAHTIWTHEDRGEAIALCAECDSVTAPEGDETLDEFQERAARRVGERADRRRKFTEEHLPEEDPGLT